MQNSSFYLDRGRALGTRGLSGERPCLQIPQLVPGRPHAVVRAELRERRQRGGAAEERRLDLDPRLAAARAGGGSAGRGAAAQPDDVGGDGGAAGGAHEDLDLRADHRPVAQQGDGRHCGPVRFGAPAPAPWPSPPRLSVRLLRA